MCIFLDEECSINDLGSVKSVCSIRDGNSETGQLQNCLYEWFCFSVSIGLFNFYSLHATVLSWCTPFLEAAWKFTLRFPRLTSTIVLYFFFDFIFLSIVLLIVLFISLSITSLLQLIQTGNVSAIMCLPRLISLDVFKVNFCLYKSFVASFRILNPFSFL